MFFILKNRQYKVQIFGTKKICQSNPFRQTKLLTPNECYCTKLNLNSSCKQRNARFNLVLQREIKRRQGSKFRNIWIKHVSPVVGM